MPRRKTRFASGCTYHIFNRGNNRKSIFHNDENYLFFLRKTREFLTPNAIAVLAYCLMSNHFHFLLKLRQDDLSDRMQRLLLSYTKTFNRRYERTGSLFEGRFRSVEVDREEYLIHLSRYIHLNPVKAGLVNLRHQWKYSSYAEYIGIRTGTLPEISTVLTEFESKDCYRRFVEAGIGRCESKIGHLLIDE